MQTFQQVFVIQSNYDGSFLTNDLSYAKSLKLAGRCYSLDEAVDTAICNMQQGEFEIHSFWVIRHD